MNRTGLGLAIGAGYLLGRTKKLKAALAVGGLVAGKKLNLSPRMVADLVSQQLRDNPQFKELGDQLRGDLRGVGKAASGALVERQLDAFADRLHGRTADVRDRLTGAARPERADEDAEEEEREPRDDEEPPAKKAPAGKAPAEAAKKAAGKVPGKKAAPAKKAAARKTAAGKTAAGKTAAASRGARSRTRKGGGEG
ncbi:DNA primase [Streptomyces sp. Tu 3180]|uniref:DNA primase n=1 Tax=Streptomyces sp. Tu 3180 TaxID=2682611 RepID=UPI00135ACD7C|nr:DNA primase [Streptomyces sp. Tu 3180]KAF3468418.1 DNA primase [Streptomyces sp. Tu 3180]